MFYKILGISLEIPRYIVFQITDLKYRVFYQNPTFLIEILGLLLEILGFLFEMLGFPKICDNRIPYHGALNQQGKLL